mmetsp:Transcript_64221/g.88219  ORF Transcript_64221/g.88219 Transcript_64221/m.88219 type:complete len:405 (-) Transcript_64221:476-1690(-)
MPGHVAAEIAKIAKIDTMPQGNTPAGVKALRFAWDVVDICNHTANQMKALTKLLYLFLLALGIFVVVLTVIQLNDDRFLTRSQLNMSISVLALAMGALSGLVTMFNPAQKWTRLRGAAMAMESETWSYRTRTGVYALKRNCEADLDATLKQRAESVKVQVLKSAGMLHTYLMSLFVIFNDSKKSSIFRHGQYRGSGMRGTLMIGNVLHSRQCCSCDEAYTATPESAQDILKLGLDDYHSPCRPDEYLKLRIHKIVHFFQKRIPAHSFNKFLSSCFLVIGSFSGVVLALFDHATWAACAIIIVAVVVAWVTFHETGKKLSRYTDALSRLDGILLWWNMMPPELQSDAALVSELVERCELLFRDERQAVYGPTRDRPHAKALHPRRSWRPFLNTERVDGWDTVSAV